MKMVTCQHCGMQYPEDQPFCPYCRVIGKNPLTAEPEQRGFPLLRVICGTTLAAAAVCLFLIVSAWNGSPEYRFLDPDSERNPYSTERAVPESGYVQPDPDSGSRYVDRRTAAEKAQSYLQYTSYSRAGLIAQLEYEGFGTEEATRAVDGCDADWNAQALKKAQSYLSMSSGFSKSGLDRQLQFEQFTAEQVAYAMEHCGADWNEQAAKSAKSYMRTFPEWTQEQLRKQLSFEGYTEAQTAYGIAQLE